jgi:short-chain fatty acids transporter
LSGIYSDDRLLTVPAQITFSETVFSNMNLYACLLLILLVPAFFYWLGKKTSSKKVNLSEFNFGKAEKEDLLDQEEMIGAEKMDRSKVFALFLGSVILTYAAYKALSQDQSSSFGFITPDYINFFLLGMAIITHARFSSFLKAVDEAIGGASGILIQFPLYFGIMGLMKSSGMVVMLSSFFVEISNEITFPIYTLFSAGLVNIFVPSGGGQWAVQGPIIVQASQELGIPLSKSSMALAYGH